jgi:hypothetical protein
VVEIATDDLGSSATASPCSTWDMGSGSSDANAAVAARSSNAFHSWAATSDAYLRPRRHRIRQRRRVEALRNVHHHRGGAREHAADPHLHASDVMGRQRQQPPAGTAESRVRFRSARAQRRHRQRRALRHARGPRCRNHQRDVVVDLGTYAQSGCQGTLSRASKAGTGSNAASPASIASSAGSRPTTSGPAGTSRERRVVIRRARCSAGHPKATPWRPVAAEPARCPRLRASFG